MRFHWVLWIVVTYKFHYHPVGAHRHEILKLTSARTVSEF